MGFHVPSAGGDGANLRPLSREDSRASVPEPALSQIEHIVANSPMLRFFRDAMRLSNTDESAISQAHTVQAGNAENS